MTTRPTAELRRRVVERAGNCCEYCLLHQDFVASTHQVDHVIAEKHGGQTALDISSIDPETDNLMSLLIGAT